MSTKTCLFLTEDNECIVDWIKCLYKNKSACDGYSPEVIVEELDNEPV